MTTQLDIRGKTFDVADIVEFNIEWDYESKIQHATITLKNGEVADFFEEDIHHPKFGELHTAKELYQRLLHFTWIPPD